MAKKNKWLWPWQLKQKGVLGINARNIFINEVNPREFYPRVDDKVITKKICKKLNVPVPETYSIIRRLGDVSQFSNLVANRQEFVVKPSRGSGGRGIVVIASHDNGQFQTPGGNIYTLPDIRHRIASILSGLYSLGGNPDKVIVEKRIKPHTIFGELAVSGTPDIRIILFRSKPVMGMLRLPTHASRGRANLHQGAVGVGVDIETGKTCGGVYRGGRVSHHPDTNVSMQGIAISHWEKILDIAARLSEAIELGYLGVDIVLDIEEGPLVLEANARPGLAIQIANKVGLRTRLKKVGAFE